MSLVLRLSVHFLYPAFHGRGEADEPEWPPSPPRLFQALLAAAAARWREPVFRDYAVPALRWLEGLPLPTIVACPAVLGARYRLYVPDNVTDKVAASWRRGNEAGIAD